MKVYAPLPDDLTKQIIEDGYQLCARCGCVMVTGDRASVVPRASWYLIFTHWHQCDTCAVRGWKAVRDAEGLRDATDSQGNSRNVFTPRPAERPCKPVLLVDGKRTLFDGMSFPACTCILDNERLYVDEPKKDPVWYEPSDELPLVSTKAEDVEQLFSKRQHGIKYQRKYIQPRNRVEEHLVTAVSRGTAGASARMLRAVTWQERARTYARHLAARPALELESTRIFSGVFVDIFKEQKTSPDDPSEIRMRRRRWFKSPLSKMKQGPMHSRDGKGRVVEWALYCGHQVEDYVRESRRGTLTPLLPNHHTNPELYEPVVRKEKKKDLDAYVELWLLNPKKASACSRPVRLRPDVFRASSKPVLPPQRLNTQRAIA